MTTILIAGGSGLIGNRLSELLSEKGYRVLLLSRKKNLEAKFPKYAWNLKNGTIDMEAIDQADFIINLAGAGIADKRWTAARKKEIIESRTKSNLLIKEAIQKSKKTPKGIIFASAIGFYGDRGTEILKEDANPGVSSFLAESTQAWENAIHQLNDLTSRKVIIRIGIVLSSQGGALAPFLLQNKFRLGTYFGNGQQFYSWIHIDDLCQIFIFAIENDQISGTFNGVSPNPVSVYDLVKSVAEAQDKKVVMIPAPSIAIRLGMGQMAEIVLSSTRVSSEKIEAKGFKFKHPELLSTLKHLVKEKI